MTEELNNEISDKDKIANLLVENQILRHKATILAELAFGISKVLDYYGSTRVTYPLYTIVDPSNGAITGEAKFKIIDVLKPGPDNEFLLGKEIYDFKFDIQTANNAYEEIFKVFEELDIKIIDEPEESTKEPEEDLQLHLDLESETNEN